MCHIQQQHQGVWARCSVVLRNGGAQSPSVTLPRLWRRTCGLCHSRQCWQRSWSSLCVSGLWSRLDTYWMTLYYSGPLKPHRQCMHWRTWLHDCAVATDSSDTVVRTLSLDYRKAFDLIDHCIPLNKLGQLGLPGFTVSWVAAFLHGHPQRVRVWGHFSAWVPVHGGIPQGTRVEPIVFLCMVNDLLEDQRQVKLADDTASCDPSAQRRTDWSEKTTGWIRWGWNSPFERAS